MSATPGGRAPSQIDAIADQYVETIAHQDPITATAIGVAGYDHLMPDLSAAGDAERADAARVVLGRLAEAEAESRPVDLDDVDRVTLSAMRERLNLELELHEAGEAERDLNVIASPLQALREVFDLMATDTIEDWQVVATRLEALPPAMTGYLEQLQLGASRGRAPAVRQLEAVIGQAEDLAGPQSFFTQFTAAASAATTGGGSSGLPAALHDRLDDAANLARAAYGQAAEVLREIAAVAPQDDAVGEERYALWSRYFLGAEIDFAETYQWGLEQLAEVVAEQQKLAAQIAGPGATIEEAIAQLDADESRQLAGTEQLQRWMQQLSDTAIAELADVHFDIPEPIRTLECRIAPTETGGIYYTGPSEDLTRPGRMWWSVPPSVTQFSTWRETTTVYHEGVPGHHLQVAQTVYRRELLNRWRRLASWVSGHGEGWALYAERLMGDLGYLDDPGDRMGMLDAQRFRAARVVLDIGVHLSLPCPDEWGGGVWNAAKAWEFLRANANMAEDFLRFELDRYLGWPGQAPSYKVGQRLWEQIRDDAQAAAAARNEAFDLKAFHRRALDVGSVGLDVLRSALA